jgi:rhamnosyl/mannosyltransferase
VTGVRGTPGATVRVLQLGKYYHPRIGGIESHLHLLCGELRPHVELEVVVCNTRARTVRETVDGVPVVRCARVGHAASTSLCPTMPFELSRRDYDLIHLHFPHPFGVMSYLGSRAPPRHAVVVTYHSDIVRQERLVKLFRPFMQRVLARADRIVCTSPNYLDTSAELAPHRDRCVVVPHGVDLDRWRRTPAAEARAAELRARHGGPLLLAVGRLVYYKGLEWAIRAMRGVEARLLVVGDGPLRGALEALARACGVGGKVLFVGEVPHGEMVSYYLASDAFVFPSVARSEAFGIAQLEAMACGLPVVNTALDSGVPFVSRDGDTGVTVPPCDAEALGSALRDLLGDPARRAALGGRARRRVELDFGKEAMARRVLSIYGEVVPGSEARRARTR